MTKQFFWGNSVSSMQTEGAWNEGGKGMSVYDVRKASENKSDWKVATDDYHRYKEDFDYMKDLGMNMYRFQISWSRVNPDGDGEFNEEGIKFYDKFIDELLKKGITPMVCLYHFDMPLKLAKKYNGFVSREVMDSFVRFAERMIDHFSGKVKYWLTFNEQNLFHMSGGFQGAGYWQGNRTLTELYMIQHHMMLAHAIISNYIHTNTDAQIGGMLAYMEIYPATSKPKDVFYARKADEFYNNNLLQCYSQGKYSDEVLKEMERFHIQGVFQAGDLEIISQMRSDWVAFSYYQSAVLNADDLNDGIPVCKYMDIGSVNNPYLKTTEWNWQIDPMGFRTALTKLHAKTNLPIFPIENGIGVIEKWDGKNPINDIYRIEYHRDHIKAMQDAINYDGVPVLGYLGWGLIDILSSQGDMRKRYGVVYVNRENHDLKDLKRVPKRSFYWLKKVIASNGKDLTIEN